jgi:hypothetical protein
MYLTVKDCTISHRIFTFRELWKERNKKKTATLSVSKSAAKINTAGTIKNIYAQYA